MIDSILKPRRLPLGITVPQALLLAGMVFELTTIGALNGGTALTASAFDALKAQIQAWLSSTLVLSLAFIGLFVGVWQLSHGRGYTALNVVLGILVTALIGPTFVTTIATASRSPMAIVQTIETPARMNALPSAPALIAPRH
jgi:hypothetical protein